MKKKLLSLVLAGAMVASTSVSAFATTTPAPTVTGTETIEKGQNEKDINVTITGNVLDDRGNVAPGNINVTVPTAANFTVGTDGTLTAGEMVITNNSNERIKVSVKEFKDPNGVQEINVIKKTTFDQEVTSGGADKGKIWLRLSGGDKVVGLESEGNGKIYDINSDTDLSSTPQELGKIDVRSNMTLRLQGAGGTKGQLQNPIRDEFKLVLKIARDRQ